MGMPAPPRTEGLGCIGGKQVGVSFLSSFPTRAQKTGWQADLYKTARIFASRFLVGEHWVHGGIAYGYSFQSDSSAVCDETDRLLQELTRQVEPHLRGLKFFGGDFNQHPGRLSECRIWEEWGYREVQDIAYELWGVPPGPTCRKTSRKDFLYLSPDLQRLITAVVNRDDLFPDHSVLFAKFQWPSKPKTPFQWRMPKPIQYDKLNLASLAGDMEAPEPIMTNLTDRYKSIWNNIEVSLQEHLAATGQPVLSLGQLGRAVTQDRHQLACKPSPPKVPRPGDPQFEFSGHSSKHVRWYKQLKRLTNFRNMRLQMRNDVIFQEHLVSLWASITRAAGFGKGFYQWWQVSQMSPQLPQGPPALQVAELILHSFEVAFRQLEKQLIQDRRKSLVARYAHDANSIFVDVRNPSHAPLETILVNKEAVVIEVPESTTAVLQGATEFDVAHPVKVSDEPVWLIDQLKQKLWFEHPHHMVPGDKVTQTRVLGLVHELHQEFERQWAIRWDRHKDVEDSKWDPICRFIDLAVPQGDLTLPPITLSQWMRTIRSKKARSAVGLDGISRQDLLALPPAFHMQLLDLFHVIETTSEWPRQLLEGAVYSLAKISDAEQVSHYRPITVLSLLFRIWSTIRAKLLLRHIAAQANAHMKGNMPGQTSVSIWWRLQQEIEDCHYDGTALTGTVADLVKAFNLLPRKPIFHMAKRIGIPSSFVNTWKAFTDGLTRRFFIDHQPSQGVQSSTGLPEGDPLSVCGMALLNLVTHAWMEQRFPSLRFLSYVDNFQLLGPNADEIMAGFDNLTQFLALVDVEIDSPKTFCWSTSPVERGHLRSAEASVVPAARDLGGHMQYIAQRSNKTVREKCVNMQDMWHRLKRSPAPRYVKLKVLQQKAWPSALYGISTVHMHKGIFTTMRQQAVEAVYNHKRGANPTIQLSMVDPCRNDPAFFALSTTVLQFRQFAATETVQSTLQVAAETKPRQRKPGPCGVLISRLENIGWMYQHGTVFIDEEQTPFDLCESPIQELHFRLRKSWCRHVATLVAHRDEFAGLDHADVAMSRVDSQWSHQAAGLLRSLQVGTFVTADKLCQAKVVDTDACEFCGASDSLAHRNMSCPGTATARADCPPWVLSQVASMPACVHRGWIPEPPSLSAYRQALMTMKVDLHDYHLTHVPDEKFTLHVFTDGTARYPNIPQARLAAWGVTLAALTPDDHPTPISQGGVPGTWQTVLRAEVCAVISALGFAQMVPHNIVLWIDNQLVVSRLTSLLQGTWSPTRKSADHDLWTQVEALVMCVSTRVTVQKVDSHQDCQDVEEWKAWAFRMNEAADSLAAQALNQLPANVVSLSHQVASEHKDLKAFKQHWHLVLLRIAQLSLDNRRHTPHVPANPPVADERPVLDLVSIVQQARREAPPRLQFSGWLRVLQWLEDIQGDESEPAEWVTWYELLWSLQINLRCRGLRTVRQNVWALDHSMDDYSVKAHTRSLSAWVMGVIQLSFPGFKSDHARPGCIRFEKWMMCIHIRFKPLQKRLVHDWLQTQLGNQTVRLLTRLQTLPPAVSEDAPVQAQPRVGLQNFGFVRRS
eukprot:Skav229361  [mRNA]  locus=scaffold3209:151155:155840:- [translate_table: standard]